MLKFKRLIANSKGFFKRRVYMSKIKVSWLYFILAIILVVIGVSFFGYKTDIDSYQIINAHEHIESMAEAEKLLSVMDRCGIDKTVLLGSPLFTLTLDPEHGFEKYKQNNEEIIKIKNRYPTRFFAFVTLNPEDKNNLELLKYYIKKGADGVKLYYGHGGKHGKGPFHTMRLDDPRMFDVFEYCEEKKIPIVFHVNLNKYDIQLFNLMEKFPDLHINIPHFMLSMWTPPRIARMEEFFKRYPNLYTDISLGRPKFLIDGFKHMSLHPKRYREFFRRNADRILFGTDMVVTAYKFKQDDFIYDVIKGYRDVLEKDKLRIFLIPGEELDGMGLSTRILKKIYETNFRKFMNY